MGYALRDIVRRIKLTQVDTGVDTGLVYLGPLDQDAFVVEDPVRIGGDRGSPMLRLGDNQRRFAAAPTTGGPLNLSAFSSSHGEHPCGDQRYH